MHAGRPRRTRAWPAGATALAALFLLAAGCAERAAEERDPSAGTNGRVLSDLSSSACTYTDLIFLGPRERAQALLPAGFVARPFTDGADVSSIVVTVASCGDGFAFSAANVFAIIEPVELPGELGDFDAANRTRRSDDTFAIDGYLLTTYSSHEELSRVLDDVGVPRAPGEIERSALTPPPASAARGTLRDDVGEILSFATTLADEMHRDVSHRHWRETPEGLVLLEAHVSAGGEPPPIGFGPAECVSRAGSELAKVTGNEPCSLAQDAPSPVTWAGRAYMFPGVTGAGVRVGPR